MVKVWMKTDRFLGWVEASKDLLRRRDNRCRRIVGKWLPSCKASGGGRDSFPVTGLSSGSEEEEDDEDEDVAERLDSGENIDFGGGSVL